MEYLLNKNLEVDINSINGDINYGKGILVINKNNSTLITKGNLKIEDFGELFVVLENGHILILIHGTQTSFISSSVLYEKKYAFYETLYLIDNSPENEKKNFEDKYLTVRCNIPLLSNWFTCKYYNSSADGCNTHLKILNENIFTFQHNNFNISLYYESRLNLGQTIQIKPLTYLIIENLEALERYQLYDVLNSAKQFYQSFFYDRFESSNLTFSNKDSYITSHSKKFPFAKDIELQKRGTMWFSFDEIKNELPIIFLNWMKYKEENSTIEDLFTDAFKNLASINRFLSAMRILEILSKRIIDEDVKVKTKQWKENIRKNQVIRSGEKKFSQCWILNPFVLYEDLITKISDTEIVNIINNRNYYTHRKFKVEGVVSPEFLDKVTSKILGISKAVFFLEIGIKKELIARVINCFNNMQYYFEPIENQNSTFHKSSNN